MHPWNLSSSVLCLIPGTNTSHFKSQAQARVYPTSHKVCHHPSSVLSTAQMSGKAAPPQGDLLAQSSARPPPTWHLVNPHTAPQGSWQGPSSTLLPENETSAFENPSNS